MNVKLINDGDSVKKEGYYKYAGHVNPHDDQDCIPTEIEKNAMPLLEGIHAPRLSACIHAVKWEFVKEFEEGFKDRFRES